MSAILNIRKNVLGIRQHEMAAISGVSQATVSRWEKGELSPSLDEIGKIRGYAIDRGILWDDALLFGGSPAPATSAEVQP